MELEAAEPVVLPIACDDILGLEEALQKLEQKDARKNKTLTLLAESTYNEAVRAIFAGEHETAANALSVAEEADFSEDKIDILRTLMDINDGDYNQAIDRAERVRDSAFETGDRLAAQAVLVSATFWAGFDWDRSEVELYNLQMRLRENQPKTETEKLLVANALILKDPREVLRLLDEMPTIRRSPIGLFIRGRCRFWITDDKTEQLLLEDAARDFEYARHFFSNEQVPLSWQVATLARLAQKARNDGKPEDSSTLYCSLGRPLVKRLLPNHHFNDLVSWQFWRAVGEREEEGNALRRLVQHGGTAHIYNAAACLRIHDAKTAVRRFDSLVSAHDKNKKWVRIARAHVVGNCPGGEAEVRELVCDLVKDESPAISHFALTALCLVSSPAEIQEYAEQAMSNNLNVTPLIDNRSCVKYFAHEFNEDTLLRNAGDSQIKRVTVFFALAMMRIAEGKREEACEYFRQCVQTNRLGCFEYELARAYMDRIESDPARRSSAIITSGFNSSR